jgi:hypothetical protein
MLRCTGRTTGALAMPMTSEATWRRGTIAPSAMTCSGAARSTYGHHDLVQAGPGQNLPGPRVQKPKNGTNFRGSRPATRNFPVPSRCRWLRAVVAETSHQTIGLRLFTATKTLSGAARIRRSRWQRMPPYLPFAITVRSG